MGPPSPIRQPGSLKNLQLTKNLFNNFRPNSTYFHVFDITSLHHVAERPGCKFGRHLFDVACCCGIQNKTGKSGNGPLAYGPELFHERFLAPQVYLHHVGFQKIRLFPGKTAF